MNKRGLYIVIEGQDGTGKTTQVELLAEYFRGQNKNVLTTKEPGGGLPSTEIIRELLKNKNYQLDPMTMILLFAANRCELWKKIIEPKLREDFVVISDRNWWSTLAYEHYGFGEPLDAIQKIHAESLPERYLKPDVGFILTLSDAKERDRRLNQRGGDLADDTFESQRDDFQTRVDRGYERIARDLGVTVVDAGGTIEEVFREIRDALNLQSK